MQNMFQCKPYSNTDYSLNDHTCKLICYSAFADNGLTNKMIPNHDSKFRDVYLIKCSYINCTQNIWDVKNQIKQTKPKILQYGDNST